MEKIDAMVKKIIYGCFAVYFFVSLICGCILKSRLEHYMAECERYRVELAAATDRQSEIAGVVGHTSLVLGETVNSVAELRVQLQAVEDDYNRLYSLCFDNGSNVSDREKQIGETKDVQ